MTPHELSSSDLAKEINRKNALIRYYAGRSDHHSDMMVIVLESEVHMLTDRKVVLKERERLDRLKVKYPKIVKLL